ncbi:hypothetical protein DM02DRAFT_586190 [Periconia macrospinosa]|uniref:Uncharacterized protein n=1 Tax=Periconia macrospinosa TaxID=97972 RepID=A0A2V1E1W0_9PLEO|nr:hypothetical protein DM02DRAFT_586190 [Periconia macrospinosa]
MDVDNEKLHCHKPNCSWLTLPRLTGIDPPTLTANPELSGIGVILGFSATAYITVALLIFHYITVYDPHCSNTESGEIVNPVDQITTDFIRKHLVAWKPKRRFEYAMEKSVLLLSDTQLVTGMAILLAGFSQLPCGISAYHWQIIVYIAWFSSFTFLAAVAFLESYFRMNQKLRLIRLFFMFALSGLQIAALLPTGSKDWLDVYGQAGDFYPSLSAECYYKQLASPSFSRRGPRIWSMVLSVVVISISYIRCGIRLVGPTPNLNYKYLGRIGNCYTRFLHLLGRKATQKGLRASFWIVPYLAFYAIFVNVRATIDCAQSMLGEILWLVGAIAWGSIKLWRTRLLVQINSDISTSNTITFHNRLVAEDAWSFGQTLPLILLLLPLLSMVQSYLDNDAKAQETVDDHISGISNAPRNGSTDSSTARLSNIRISKSVPISSHRHYSSLPQLPRYPYPSFASHVWYIDHICLQIWQVIMLATYVLIIQDITINVLGVSFLLRSRIFLLWVFACIPLTSLLHLAFWYAAASIVMHIPGTEDWLNGSGPFRYKGDKKFWLWRVTKGQWMAWGLRTGLKIGLLLFTFLVSQELAGPMRLEFDS